MRTQVDHKRISEWMGKRDVELGEDFGYALSKYAKAYKKNNLASVNEVYLLLGIDRHRIHHWRNNPAPTMSRTRLKHSAIASAGVIFGLNEDEVEELANKAGLSMCADISFVEKLTEILQGFTESKRRLCEVSLVSERMLRYIQKGKHLKKEPVLALAISSGANIENIQALLKKAGYILSQSLPGDMVVMWMLQYEQPTHGNISVLRINEELYSLGLPMLMTGERGQEVSE